MSWCSLNKTRRQRDLLRVTHENQAILKRIQSKEPHYNHLHWVSNSPSISVHPPHTPYCWLMKHIHITIMGACVFVCVCVGLPQLDQWKVNKGYMVNISKYPHTWMQEKKVCMCIIQYTHCAYGPLMYLYRHSAVTAIHLFPLRSRQVIRRD